MRKFLFLLLIAALLPMFFSVCKSQPLPVEEIPEPEPDIEVLEPVFEIVSIIIIQADLVNTQFETVLKVSNPNSFAISLLSIKYRLYSNGLLWADGAGNEVLQVLANSSSETKFRFTMNFINTNRKLLDDIIAMRQVRYRFNGEAEVRPDIPRLPPFVINFDISGLSDVKQKAN